MQANRTATYRRPILKPKSCAVCGAEFMPNAGHQRYCSSTCRAEATKATFTCAHCGRTFSRQRSRGGLYCSMSCSNRANASDRRPKGTAPVVVLRCPQCGTDFERQSRYSTKFCSRSCAMKARHARARSAKPTWSLRCKGETQCRACGRMASHLHHVIPRSRSRATAADVYRNGIPLCAGCHRGWHDRLVVIHHSALTDPEFAFVIGVVGSAWIERNYPDTPIGGLFTLDRVRRGRFLPHDEGHEPLRARTLRLLGVEWLTEAPLTAQQLQITPEAMS